MSGGGSNGAWEIGVLWGLTHYGDPEKYKWDVVTGVSIGSVNSALLALWKPGEEIKATEYISNLWAQMSTDDIYESWLKNWFFIGDVVGEIAGLWRTGIYSTEPGKKWFQKMIGKLAVSQDT